MLSISDDKKPHASYPSKNNKQTMYQSWRGEASRFGSPGRDRVTKDSPTSTTPNFIIDLHGRRTGYLTGRAEAVQMHAGNPASFARVQVVSQFKSYLNTKGWVAGLRGVGLRGGEVGEGRPRGRGRKRLFNKVVRAERW